MNIGLVKHHNPVLGVIYLPVQEVRYYADVNGSFKQLRVKKPREICTEKDVYPMVLRAAVARSNFRSAEALFIKRNCVRRLRYVGGTIKFCLIADGYADVYYQEGRTHEWGAAGGAGDYGMGGRDDGWDG